MATTNRKTAAEKRAEAEAASEARAARAADKAEAAETKDRKVHFLIRQDDAGRVTAIEPFNGEMAARRGLDDHIGWRYLGLRPGELFEVEQTAVSS